MARPDGVLRYSEEARGWVFWLGDLPDLVTHCPSCKGRLPLMIGQVPRVVGSNPDGPWQVGEGAE